MYSAVDSFDWLQVNLLVLKSVISTLIYVSSALHLEISKTSSITGVFISSTFSKVNFPCKKKGWEQIWKQLEYTNILLLHVKNENLCIVPVYT